MQACRCQTDASDGGAQVYGSADQIAGVAALYWLVQHGTGRQTADEMHAEVRRKPEEAAY